MYTTLLLCINALFGQNLLYDFAEYESIPSKAVDSVLRVLNLNAVYILSDDSVVSFELKLNRAQENYYWYLKGNPPGTSIDNSNGILYFKPDKTLFKTGLLQYNQSYQIELGVIDKFNPGELFVTSFEVLFYNKSFAAGRLTPSISETIYAEEGDSIKFTIQCDHFQFSKQQIGLSTNFPISNYKPVKQCNDEFAWLIPYDFIKDYDSLEEKELRIKFFTSNTWLNTDTAIVRVLIKPGIDYPLKYSQYKKISSEISRYIQSLKLTFYVSNKNVRANKRTRTLFDVAGSATALTSSLLPVHSEDGNDLQKILPAVGLTLIPVKETLVPAKTQEKSNANTVRSVAKKLEYTLNENRLLGDKDPGITDKIKILQEELKQSRLQLMELPLIEYDENLSIEDAEKYFRDYKVKKKHKLLME